MYINREIDTYKWATTTTTTTTFRREWASEFVAERKNAAIYVTQRCTRCIERTKLRAEWERESEWKGDKKAKMTNTHTCWLWTNHTKVVIRNGRDRKTKERKERNREWRSRKKHTHSECGLRRESEKGKKNTIQRPANIHTPNENKTMDSNVSKKESKNSL